MAKQKKPVLVAFRADAEVVEAIDKLTAATDTRGINPGAARAGAIRRTLLDAAKRLEKGELK